MAVSAALAGGAAARRIPLPILAGAPAVLLTAPLLFLLLVAVAITGAPKAESGLILRHGVSRFALSDIPARFLELYQASGEAYELDWAVLAAIGKVETDHGRLQAPGVSSGENFAGAGGPMQFLAPTWAAYGVDADGDGAKDRYDPADAIAGAANYLKASGAPASYEKAIFAYNHANWYVAKVLAMAARYRGELLGIDADIVAGATAVIGSDGLARAPEEAPDAVKRMIAAGNSINDRPYVYGGGHPDFLAAHGLDCSSSTSLILNAGGIFGTSALVSGQFESWGEPGPGRWVTIYANASHVYTVIAGIRNDTGRYDSGPNAGESGPRWRQGHRPSAGFVIRHPPGL